MPSLSSQIQVDMIVNSTTNQKICQYEYWTPIIWSNDELSWVTMNNSVIKTKAEFLPWNPGSTAFADENCVIIDHINMFQTEKCSVEHCFPCQFQQQVF